MNRAALQDIVTALDLNRMSLADARRHVRKMYGLEIPNRSKEGFISKLSSCVKAIEQSDGAAKPMVITRS